jgi:hypothetical protein
MERTINVPPVIINILKDSMKYVHTVVVHISSHTQPSANAIQKIRLRTLIFGYLLGNEIDQTDVDDKFKKYLSHVNEKNTKRISLSITYVQIESMKAFEESLLSQQELSYFRTRTNWTHNVHNIMPVYMRLNDDYAKMIHASSTTSFSILISDFCRIPRVKGDKKKENIRLLIRIIIFNVLLHSKSVRIPCINTNQDVLQAIAEAIYRYSRDSLQMNFLNECFMSDWGVKTALASASAEHLQTQNDDLIGVTNGDIVELLRADVNAFNDDMNLFEFLERTGRLAPANNSDVKMLHILRYFVLRYILGHYHDGREDVKRAFAIAITEFLTQGSVATKHLRSLSKLSAFSTKKNYDSRVLSGSWMYGVTYDDIRKECDEAKIQMKLDTCNERLATYHNQSTNGNMLVHVCILSYDDTNKKILYNSKINSRRDSYFAYKKLVETTMPELCDMTYCVCVEIYRDVHSGMHYAIWSPAFNRNALTLMTKSKFPDCVEFANAIVDAYLDPENPKDTFYLAGYSEYLLKLQKASTKRA